MAHDSSNSARVFLIDTFYQGQDMGVTWRLDQRVAAPGSQREETRLYNQVQAHLSELGRTTGFDYSIRYWGGLDGVDSYLEEQQLVLH